MRAAVLHLGDLRVRIVRVGPVRVRALLLALTELERTPRPAGSPGAGALSTSERRPGVGSSRRIVLGSSTSRNVPRIGRADVDNDTLMDASYAASPFGGQTRTFEPSLRSGCSAYRAAMERSRVVFLASRLWPQVLESRVGSSRASFWAWSTASYRERADVDNDTLMGVLSSPFDKPELEPSLRSGCSGAAMRAMAVPLAPVQSSSGSRVASWPAERLAEPGSSR